MVFTSFNRSVLARHQSSHIPLSLSFLFCTPANNHHHSLLFLSFPFHLSKYSVLHRSTFVQHLLCLYSLANECNDRRRRKKRKKEENKNNFLIFFAVFFILYYFLILMKRINNDDDYFVSYCCSSIDQTEGGRNSSVRLSLLSKCHPCRVFSLCLDLIMKRNWHSFNLLLLITEI